MKSKSLYLKTIIKEIDLKTVIVQWNAGEKASLLLTKNLI